MTLVFFLNCHLLLNPQFGHDCPQTAAEQVAGRSRRDTRRLITYNNSLQWRAACASAWGLHVMYEYWDNFTSITSLPVHVNSLIFCSSVFIFLGTYITPSDKIGFTAPAPQTNFSSIKMDLILWKNWVRKNLIQIRLYFPHIPICIFVFGVLTSIFLLACIITLLALIFLLSLPFTRALFLMNKVSRIMRKLIKF